MGESVDDRSADAKSGEGAWSRHKSNFGDILPGCVILC